MAIYTFPYPAGTANQNFNWIGYEGRDLIGYKTPRGDPNPVFDRFVGYLDVDWNAVNAANGAPMIYSGPTNPPTQAVTVNAGVADSSELAVPNTPTVTGVQEPTRARDGDDLVLTYPNGTADRYRNYFNPTAGTVAAVDTSKPWESLPANAAPLRVMQSSQIVGNDFLITWNDGTQKILTNYTLPRVPNPAAYLGGNYPMEWRQDPETLVHYGINPGKPWLSSDRIEESGDRVAVYSDGSSIRIPNWVQNNPQYTAVPTNAVNLFDTDNVEIDTYYPPDDVFIADPRYTDNPTPQVVTPTAPGVAVSTPFPGGSGTLNGNTISNILPAPQVLPPPSVVTPSALETPMTGIAIALGLALLVALN